METIPTTLDELIKTWRGWQGMPETVSPMERLVALAWISAGVATVRYLPGRVCGDDLMLMLDELREHPERRYALFSVRRSGFRLQSYERRQTAGT